ncbi:MAG: nitrilase [Cytophagaceae bacterium]|jgi:predicted amidohydrolase|nr:nitrilase [Cytophagaceae bacterium]
MQNLKIAAAQFEPKDGDKAYNLSVIEALTARAKLEGADVVSFHELSVTAYTYLKNISKSELFELAEPVPNGASTQELIRIATQYDIAILAGLVEIEDDKVYNTYICVDKTGLKAKYRKIHPFISTYLSAGNEYVVFDLLGWKCGILICYDNNVIENVRATTLLGADLIFAPHVTMCTPSAMPGRGYVEDRFWKNRTLDPVSLRQEFDGPKGRAWLMRWLPARAYDNGVYYVFTNPIGYDGEHLKNGNSLILDPYGEVLAEVKSFENDLCIAILTEDKLKLAGGYRYKKARRPDLYRAIIGQEHQPETKPVWLEAEKKSK